MHTDTEPCKDHVHFADEDNEAPRASEICLKSQSGSEISHAHHYDVKDWTLSPPSKHTHTHTSQLLTSRCQEWLEQSGRDAAPEQWSATAGQWTAERPHFLLAFLHSVTKGYVPASSPGNRRVTPFCLPSEVAITLPLLGLWQKQAKKDPTFQQPGLCLSCSKCFQVRGEGTAVQS